MQGETTFNLNIVAVAAPPAQPPPPAEPPAPQSAEAATEEQTIDIYRGFRTIWRDLPSPSTNPLQDPLIGIRLSDNSQRSWSRFVLETDPQGNILRNEINVMVRVSFPDEIRYHNNWSRFQLDLLGCTSNPRDPCELELITTLYSMSLFGDRMNCSGIPEPHRCWIDFAGSYNFSNTQSERHLQDVRNNSWYLIHLGPGPDSLGDRNCTMDYHPVVAGHRPPVGRCPRETPFCLDQGLYKQCSAIQEGNYLQVTTPSELDNP